MRTGRIPPPYVWLWVCRFIFWKVCFWSLSQLSLQSREDAGVSLCWVGAEPAWEAHEAAQRRWWSHSHREDPLSLCGEMSYSRPDPQHGLRGGLLSGILAWKLLDKNSDHIAASPVQ